jgi:ACS family hexuronate transporter-like MFS transporter
MFFGGGIINYIDRAALGVVMPQIKKDLLLTNTDFAIAVNSFLISYGAFYILGGWLADRLGTKRAYPVMVVCWSIANMLHAFSRSLASLCVFRAFLGIAEGGYFPTAIRGATEWFTPERRANPIALYLCGSSLGALLTPPLVAWTALRFGWRGGFVALGSVGVVLVPFWFLLQRRIFQAYGTQNPAPASVSVEGPSPSSTNDGSLRGTLKSGKYWLVLASRALCDSVWFFYIFWMPGYLQEVRGFSLDRVGKSLWIPYLIADVGALTGAWVSGVLIRRGFTTNQGRKIVLVISAVLSMIGCTSYFAKNTVLSLALLGLALFGALSYGASINTVITEIIPRKHVAILYGITGASGTMLGVVTQFLVGRLVDTSGYKFPFIGAGLAFALALALLLRAGKVEPIRHS